MKKKDLHSVGITNCKTAACIKRKYITRRSSSQYMHSSKKGRIHSITNAKTQVFYESVNDSIHYTTNANTQGINETNNDSIHPFTNTKIPLLSDSKNGIMHSVTNVKAPVFKYSKCRTCRIPCNGDFFSKLSFNSDINFQKKRDIDNKLEVKVEKINSSKYLKLNDNSNIRPSEEIDESIDWFVDNKQIKSPEKAVHHYKSKKVYMLNGCNQGKDERVCPRNSDCYSENQLLKFAANVPIQRKLDNFCDIKLDKSFLKNEDTWEEVVQLHLPIDTFETTKKVDMGIKELPCVSVCNSLYIDSNSPANFQNIATDIIGNHLLLNAEATIKTIGTRFILDTHKINTCSGELSNKTSNCCTIDINIEHELKDITINDNEYLPNNGGELENDSDRRKSSNSTRNDENMYSMVLSHLQKEVTSNDSAIYNGTKNLQDDISDKKNIDSKCLHELSCHHYSITNIGEKDKHFDTKGNIISCNTSSSNNTDENYKYVVKAGDNDILVSDETWHGDDVNLTSSVDNQINLVNVTNEYVLCNVKDKCKILPTMQDNLQGKLPKDHMKHFPSDENDSFMNIECKSQLGSQETISDRNLLNATCGIVSYDNVVFDSSRHLSKTLEIVNNIDMNLSGNTKENGIGIVGNLEANHRCQEHMDKYQGCECCVIVSDCSKYIFDLKRNIASDHFREHNLIHNRKHVRLKESKGKSLNSSLDFGLLKKEAFTGYVFESARRLKLLHNRFYAPVVTPDEVVMQSMLGNIEIDIEIFEEDSYVTNKCEWNACNMQFDESAKLLDHLKKTHIYPASNSSIFICLWRRCKFSNQPSSSYKWLSKHVLRHCCIRPFKCVILGCEISFATQSGLARHVPSHFNEGKVRRTCVLTGVDKSQEYGTRTKIDIPLNLMDNSEDTDESTEPIRKRTRHEKFVDTYKPMCTANSNHQNGLNGVKYKLQISTCNSSVSSGYVGKYFRFNHKVIGKRTLKDGSTDMLLSPSSTKIFPHKSFWVDGNTFDRQKSLFVDISVNNLSDDVKQHLYDNEQVLRLNSKEKNDI